MKVTVILLLLMVLMTLIILEFVASQPVPDKRQLNETAQLDDFNAMKFVSDTTKVQIKNSDNPMKMKIKKNQIIPQQNLPSSPVGLLRPDTFQFYTFNQNGDVVMKQMSKKEIHSLIASSSGHIPMEIHESQMIFETQPDETKVADVVQNVQNVLRSELNKPPPIMTSMPTIPGHENSDWSNILPSILAGDMDPNVTSKPNHYHDSDVMEVGTHKPISDLNSETFSPIESGMYDTKPMIPIAVMTAEKQPPIYSDEEKIVGLPIFHILNINTTNENNNATYGPNLLSSATIETNTMSDVFESDVPCPLLTANCINNSLHTQKRPDNTLLYNDELTERNKNETTNEINPEYLTNIEIHINESINNHVVEEPKPFISITTIETQYAIPNSSEMKKIIGLVKCKPSVNINENNMKVDSVGVFDTKEKPQCQGENDESNVSDLSTKTPELLSEMDNTKATTTFFKNPTILHQTQLTNNEMSIIELDSVHEQQADAINGIQQINMNQTTDLVTNVFYDTLNNSSTQVSAMTIQDEILSTPSEYISYGSSSSIIQLDYSDTTAFTSIPKIDEAYSSTKSHISHTTITPISYEKYASIIPNETTNNAINNSNFNTANDMIVVSHKIYTQPITPRPIVLDDPNAAATSTEPISHELANSLSSMISQISVAVPSIISSSDKIHKSKNVTDVIEINDGNDESTIKNYEVKSDSLNTTKNSTNMDILHNHIKMSQYVNTTKNFTNINKESHGNIVKNFEYNNNLNAVKEKTIEKIHETPIVRIDIMETRPNINQNINATIINNITIDDYHNDDVKTESPMVRIKLTDPISTLNHILESSSIQASTKNSIEIVTLPTNRNISANGIGSGLIAGFNSNFNESTSSKYSELINTTKADGIISNKTSEKVDSTTRKSVVTMNIISLPKTTETQTHSIDINHISSYNTSEMNQIPINDVLLSTELMGTVNLSPCFHKNSSSEQTNSSIISSCSAPTDVTSDNNKTTTNSAEESIMRPLSSTAVPLNYSTKSFNNNEVIKHELAPQSPTITGSQEIRVDHTTENFITKIANKVQLEEQMSLINKPATTSGILQFESVNVNLSEHTDDKSENFSLNIGQIMEFGAPLNQTSEQSYLYTQQGEFNGLKLHENTQNNSTITTPNKIKDKKTDDLQIDSLETAVNKKIDDISVKSDNTSTPIEKPVILDKLNLTHGKKTPEKWTLIPQKNHSNTQDNGLLKTNPSEHRIAVIKKESNQAPKINAVNGPKGASGLDSSIEKLDADISYFSILCNDLAFKYWNSVNSGLSTSRSIAISPFGMTSILAMLFLGARSPTSDRMNEVLKLDDVTSFNPHLVFQNITDSVGIAQNQGIANVAFVRELFIDQNKVRKLMRFYKKQAEQFYDGMVEQVNFLTISDAVRRKTNFLIRKQTGGRIRNFVKTNTVPLRSPLAALSANVFQTNCNSNDATSRGRDGELYFAVSPAVRQRKLVLVPATLWKAGVLAGYEPSLDATAYAIGGVDKIVSTIFVVPGQQGSTATNDNLDLLEQRIISGVLHDAAWNKLLKVIVPRTGLELQIPKFSHKSIINATAALKIMGLENLFNKCADFKGINGVGNDFHLADVMQMNMFSTCGDENIQSGKTKHHIEIYPASPQRNARGLKYNDNKADADNYDLSENIFKSLESLETINSSSNTTTAQTIIEDKQRVKLDKPFLYFVRHNPTGLILFMGRFNPRLLP